MTSVLQPWVTELTFKQQTVLMSAIRGCDGVGKEDISKKLVRSYRSTILEDASGGGSLFMDNSVTRKEVMAFLKQIDHYPIHWFTHFMHAVQIVGYYDCETSVWWDSLYRAMAGALHLNPETKIEHEARLADGFKSDCHKA